MNIQEDVKKIRDAAGFLQISEDDCPDDKGTGFIEFAKDVSRWLFELADIKENGTTLIGALCTCCGKTMTVKKEIFMAYDDGCDGGKKGVCVDCAEKEPEIMNGQKNGMIRQVVSGEFGSVEITCEGCGANDVPIPPSNPKRVRCGRCGRTIEIG